MTPEIREAAEKKMAKASEILTCQRCRGPRLAGTLCTCEWKKNIEEIQAEHASALLALLPKAGEVLTADGVVRKVLESAEPESGCSKIGELLCQHELEPDQTVMILEAASAQARAGEGRKE